ncbi:hypothetical protein [uncultured Winogradskyella sp.]|uniref:hypothetical protein n=1 Tax=uncultured Winogradskyella sp. TaxID=395353 RepID=UPI0026396CEF|nr:hypothetical protein [uncultured Winogradskyella sp.]
MKKLALLLVMALAFMGCEKDELNENQENLAETEVLGTWELYRDENLESIPDEWTGTEWTTVDKWFQNTRENSEIILEFKEDNTFIDRYADVEVANGIWGLLNDGRIYFDYIQGETTNEQLTQRRFLTIHCDNTYSIEIEGNDRAVYYYRKMGTTECADLINYNVE